MPIEEFPGQRRNTRVFFFDHEPGPYYLDSRYGTKRDKYYRCATRSGETQCDASVLVYETGVVRRFGEHNHAIDPHAKSKIVFREQVRQLALNIQLEPAEVLRRACIANRESGERCSASAMISFIKRIRKDMYPQVPPTLALLGEVLENYAPLGNIYRSTVTAGGASAVIFASLEMLQFLNTAKWLHIDGTFSGYAAVFVLCERRTRSIYDAIWRSILQLCPQLQDNLRSVWTDYENAAMASLRANFPRIRLRGCWFHFCNAVKRKWKSLRMANPPTEILHLAYALPLLPANKIGDGCRAITAITDPLAVDGHERLNTFTHYLRQQWERLADVVSVDGTAIRTNNVAESFNRHSRQALGGHHPRIWIFLEKLKAVIEYEGIKMQQWRRTGRNKTRPQHQAWIRIDEHIAEAQRHLTSGRWTVTDFLRGALDPYQRIDIDFTIDNISGDDDEHEPPVPEDVLNPPDVFPDDPAQDPVAAEQGPRPRRNGHRVIRRNIRADIIVPNEAEERVAENINIEVQVEPAQDPVAAEQGPRPRRNGPRVIRPNIRADIIVPNEAEQRVAENINLGAQVEPAQDPVAEVRDLRQRRNALQPRRAIINDGSDSDENINVAAEIVPAQDPTGQVTGPRPRRIARRIIRRIISDGSDSDADLIDPNNAQDRAAENINAANPIEPPFIHRNVPDDAPIIDIVGVLNNVEMEMHAGVADDTVPAQAAVQALVVISDESENEVEPLQNLEEREVVEEPLRVGGDRVDEVEPRRAIAERVGEREQPLQAFQGGDNEADNAGGVAGRRMSLTRSQKKNIRKKKLHEARVKRGGNPLPGPTHTKRRRKIRRGPNCVVCLIEPIRYILIPCGHVCLCENCVAVRYTAINNKCPICRTPIQLVNRVYAQ